MIQKERLAKDFEAMARLTDVGDGINRLAFTDADWAGRQYIVDRMIDAGLTVKQMDLAMLSVIKLVKILIYQWSWWGLTPIVFLMGAIMMVWLAYYLP